MMDGKLRRVKHFAVLVLPVLELGPFKGTLMSGGLLERGWLSGFRFVLFHLFLCW